MSFNIEEVIELRKKLRDSPELAFQEKKTVQILKDYISKYQPDQTIQEIAQTGIAFIFKGEKNKKSIMLRADLDALPLTENNQRHMCGHDGHMAMVAGVAPKLKELKNRGDVILFFQPAEETGQGAYQSLQDERFYQLQPDYTFALHNLPQHEQGVFYLKNNTFACSSVGIEVKISGASSHAANPDLTINPLEIFYPCYQDLCKLRHTKNDPNFFIITLTHLNLGTYNFGISPGEMLFCLTLRAAQDNVLSDKKNIVRNIVQKNFQKNFQITIGEREYFPATVNHAKAVSLIEKSLKDLNFKYQYNDAPMGWSEDFGHFTQHFKGAYLGLGAGNCAPLHHPDYDFNEQILEDGIRFYCQLINNLNN